MVRICPLSRIAVALLVVLFSALLLSTIGHAAVTAEQRAKIAAAGREVAAAEKLAKAGKVQDAAEPLGRAIAALAEALAGGDKDVARLAAPIRKRIEAIHADLEIEGIALPPLKFDMPGDAKPPNPKPTDPKPTDPKPAIPPVTPAGKVSFTKQVAPLLVSKCGRCHIDDTKGKLSMTTFAALQKGNVKGVVIMPKKSQGSRIVEVIESDDMPRGGAKVTKPELAMLSKWIDEGALFDGPNANVPLKQIAAAAVPRRPEQPKLEVVVATGNESTSFARDVGSVMIGTCMNCHGERQPRANFSVATFERLLRGGDGGQVIVPGKPAESLLVKKLRGTAGMRMPLRLPPLEPAAIEKIEKWIAEGAKFDGSSAQAPTEQVVSLYTAQHSTHEELSERRAALAKTNWRLAVPGEENKPTVLETKNFLLYGRLEEAKLQEVADAAEKQMAKVAYTLKAPQDKPFIKGRMTLYVFQQRYDYGEFGQMVEKRQLPPVWRGHWGYSIVDAYACLVLPKEDEPSLDNLLTQVLAGTYVASQGPGVPRWFAEGSARAVLASVDSRDKRIKQWNNAVPPLVAAMPKADAFLTGLLPPEEADVISYGFVKDMKLSSRAYQKLLEALRGGTPFDKAFAQVYRATPMQMALSWARTKR